MKRSLDTISSGNYLYVCMSPTPSMCWQPFQIEPAHTVYPLFTSQQVSNIYLLAGSAELRGQTSVLRQAIVLILLQGLRRCVATEHVQAGLEP
jgi:hypothetical protein